MVPSPTRKNQSLTSLRMRNTRRGPSGPTLVSLSRSTEDPRLKAGDGIADGPVLGGENPGDMT